MWRASTRRSRRPSPFRTQLALAPAVERLRLVSTFRRLWLGLRVVLLEPACGVVVRVEPGGPLAFAELLGTLPRQRPLLSHGIGAWHSRVRVRPRDDPRFGPRSVRAVLHDGSAHRRPRRAAH